MPTPIMHLAQAQEILNSDGLTPAARRLLSRERGPFFLGHTAPDVQTVSGQRRDETHFYTLPRTSTIPSYQALFAAHPELARPERLPSAQAAFLAGYIAHLLLDELWLEMVFTPYFEIGEGSHRQRVFLHNVLRTWLDQRDQQRLNRDTIEALRQAEPRQWLPFVSDEHLRAWRDWLIEQLESGQEVQTAEVFAQRMDVSVEEIEAILTSPQRMQKEVFGIIPEAILQSFHDVGYSRSIELVNGYLVRSGSD